MPELFIIWIVGAAIAFVLSNIHLLKVHLSYKNRSYLQLNGNLLKINHYWSIEKGRLMTIPGDSTTLSTEKDHQSILDLDYQRATRAAFLFGTLLIFLSWLGIFLHLIYWISEKFFLKTRLEHNIFSSRLACELLDPLSGERVFDEVLKASQIERSTL
jgi:hypothetical protein